MTLYKDIVNNSLSIGIGYVSVKIIDKINIRQATLLSMEKAIADLRLKPDIVLVDGIDKLNISIPCKNIVKGDTKIDCIMAASIVAKVTRDNIMENYSIIFPEYDFGKNKGYGTKSHMESLKINMATPIHRKSFKPVSSYLPSFKWLKMKNKMKWMGVKLSCLYLTDKDYKIEAIEICYKIEFTIDIIAHYNDVTVFLFINLLGDSEKEKSINPVIKNKIKIKQLLSDFVENSNLSINSKWRVDILNVDLYNKKSQFEHLEGMINSK